MKILNNKSNKYNRIYKNFLFLILIIFFYFISFISCVQNNKIIKTYSYFPSESEIEEIFQSNDYNKIIKYYLFFQNTQNISFKNSLQEKMVQFLETTLISSLDAQYPIQIITRNLNNYLLIKEINNQKDESSNSNLFDYRDELVLKSIKYLTQRIDKIENYYFYNSYLNYIETIFPDFINEFNNLNEKKFDNIKFVNSYEDVYKNTAMIISDRGVKIENGQSVPDISIGTGFFIDKNKVVTNYHVVNTEGKKYRLSIKLNSYTFPATILLFDETLDLAILEIPYDNPDFKYFKINKNIKIGDEVIASGNPYGLSFSNTKGIVSNLDRKFLELGNVIQVDTPLNPGNSGGPAFNPSFELVGIAFASILNSQNLNFILPVSFLLDILPELYIDVKIDNNINSDKNLKSNDSTNNQTGTKTDNINTDSNIEVKRSWLGFYFYENNLLYQVKGTASYKFFSSFNFSSLQDLRILYNKNLNPTDKNYFIFIQHYISALPELSFVPVRYNNKIYLLLSERRPKYPMNFAISNDYIDNCLSIIFDSVLTKEGDYYRIEKLYNPEISLFYGIYQGDLIKIVSFLTQSQKKVIIIYINIKHPRYGGILQQYAITISFSQPGFF